MRGAFALSMLLNIYFWWQLRGMRWQRDRARIERDAGEELLQAIHEQGVNALREMCVAEYLVTRLEDAA